MNKRVLVIVSSPRKGGNSEILAEQFIKGAEESGNAVEKICLRDCNINYCMACEYCMRHGGVCAQKDDMNWILEKMREADTIVLTTPVYKSCMCAQLKTLAERIFAGNSILINKEFYFIATAADSHEAIESTMQSMRGITYAFQGARIKEEIYGANALNKGDILNSPAMKQAYEAGKNC